MPAPSMRLTQARRAGVRKPSVKEPAGSGARWCRSLYGDLGVTPAAGAGGATATDTMVGAAVRVSSLGTGEGASAGRHTWARAERFRRRTAMRAEWAAQP